MGNCKSSDKKGKVKPLLKDVTKLVNDGDVEGLRQAMKEKVTIEEGTVSLAAQKGVKEVLEVLCNAGARVEHRNEDGETPLMIAAIHNHAEAVEYLFAQGGNLDARNSTNETALILAVERGALDSIKTLLALGADTSLKDSFGKTAKQLAIDEGHDDVAKLFNE
eukprot:TRINITY_DN1989_c0_g1_i2.p2 TRINITY_DN1989_c0_g1~~TRINITY_DN1989_c0_g1_i2.p2  ORF type:complete len:164 (+),score=44.95 TRINITY_DN1989_c0_g1_i2:1307-1798(+)